MKKILLSAVILGFWAIVGVVVVVVVAGRDISPPETSDLIPERTELPPDQNGYNHPCHPRNPWFIPNTLKPLDFLPVVFS